MDVKFTEVVGAIAALCLLFVTSSAAFADPQIISRAQWGAKPASLKMKAHTPTFITVHHSAVPQRKGDLKRKMRNLQNFSQKRERLASGKMKVAWADVPYHFVINAAGQIAEGRDIHYAGDTNTNYDPKNHVQIVLQGNFQREQPTKAQLQKLEDLLVMQARRWKIPASKIEGHKHHASTLCPGKNLFAQIPALRQRVAAKVGK